MEFKNMEIVPYDHLLRGNIKIKNNKVKIKNFTDLLTYQSWSDTFNKFNSKRTVNFLTVKSWVDINFKKYNKGNPIVPYCPTTVMQIGYKKYVFVIKNAIYNENKKYKLVFHISTKAIDSKNKPKIPKGYFKRVRFDIDGFDKKIGNLINNLVPKTVMDSSYFKVEQEMHNTQQKYKSYISNMNSNDIPPQSFIDNGVPIWNQGQTGSCVAHSTCFLFTTIMAVGLNKTLYTADSWDTDTAPVKSSLINWLTSFYQNIDKTYSFSQNCNKAGPSPLDECFFSRSFILWAAYYTPLGSYPNITTPQAPPIPSINNGSFIFDALAGLQIWGAVPITQNSNQLFGFNEFISGSPFGQFTNLTYGDKVVYPNLPNNFTKNDSYMASTNFNENTYYNNVDWTNQQKNNFTIYPINQDASAIIGTLAAGYPISFTMAIINYGYDGNGGIGLITTPYNLEYVLQWTDTSQTKNNIPIEYHALVAVGYLLSGQEYYVTIRNSWGPSWGNGGYFHMPLSYLTTNDSITGSPNCSGLYTIALNSDHFIPI